MTKAPIKPRKTTKKAVRAADTLAAETASASAPMAAATSPLKQPRQTKSALLCSRLGDPGGASMAALMGMTGWQAHTLRAALSRLRKEGLTLTRRREGEDTIYAIAAGTAEAAEADPTPTDAATGAEALPNASGVESATVADAESAIPVTEAEA